MRTVEYRDGSVVLVDQTRLPHALELVTCRTAADVAHAIVTMQVRGAPATINGERVAPPGIRVANPAFDITPHEYVTAIITEVGILRPPYEDAIAGALARPVTALAESTT